MPRGQYITWVKESSNAQTPKLYPVVDMLLRLSVVKPVHSVAAQIVVEALFLLQLFIAIIYLLRLYVRAAGM